MQKYLFYIICLLISLTMVCCSENDSDNSPKTTIPTKIEEDSINTKDDTNKVDTIYFQIQKDNIILSIGETETVDIFVNLHDNDANFDKDNGNYNLQLKFAQNDLQPENYFVSKVEQINDGNDTRFRLYIEDLCIKNNYNDSVQIRITKKGNKTIYLSSKLRISLSCDNTTRKYLDTNLPLVKIETVNNEEPKCDYVSPPNNCWGAGIKNATKVPGKLLILKNDDILYYSGEYDKGNSGMTLKIRGNTSAYHDKKPYKIKLQKKADLLSRKDDNNYKDKEWVLLKYDGLKALVGFKLNELIGMQWTPSFQYVNVMINGDYRGLYMLCESVKRNPNCRINVDETGYIIEYDAYWWNENVYFVSDYSDSMNYTFKYPDEENISQEQIDYIKQYVKTLETTILKEGQYENYMDVDSWAKWLLLQDILGNSDSAGANIYFTKFDNTETSKLMMGNLWDFDSSFKVSTYWSVQHTADLLYFPKLLANKNMLFKNTYKSYWTKISPNLVQDMNTFLDEFARSETAAAVNTSITSDNQRWGYESSHISEEISTFKAWFVVRLYLLNQMIPNL